MTSTTGVPGIEHALFHVYVWSSVLEFSSEAYSQTLHLTGHQCLIRYSINTAI